MTTLGAQIIERLNALETAMTDLQLDQPQDRRPVQPAIMAQIETLRNELQELQQQQQRNPIRPGPDDNASGKQWSLFRNKECLPPILGNDYKTQWRTWSYRARDCIAQLDNTLRPKLLQMRV